MYSIAGRAVSLTLLLSALSLAGGPEFLYDDDAAPIFAQSNLSPAAGALAKMSADERDRTHCLRFLESIAPAHNTGMAFDITGMDREADQTHFRIRQLENGIPVFGSEGRVILDAGQGQGNIAARFTGRLRMPSQAGEPVTASLGSKDALLRAWSEVAGRPMAAAPFIDTVYTGEPSMLETTPELIRFQDHSLLAPAIPMAARNRLAWRLAVRANFLELWEILVDAQDGSILMKFPVHCSAGPAIGNAPDLHGVRRGFGTWLGADAKYYLIDAGRAMFDPIRSKFPDQTVGALVTMDLANTRPSNPTYSHITSADNTWNNAAAVSAHYHASVAYDYYLRVHGRNSIKGMGGTVRSFINVAGPDGAGMDNAYWNGHSMFYGNGNVLMTSMSGSLDVSGHELTHGVVEATANLRYRGQSGAINESMADIFGAMMDRDDWQIGEDVVKKTWFKSGALRDLANPNQGVLKGENGWQPAHMSDYQVMTLNEAGDFGGVHANSGIPNHAFYQFATRVGKEKAEQVYYRALTRYLNPASQFIDLRLAVTLSAQDLYGQAEIKAAEDAFSAVGIGKPVTTVPKANVLPPVAGPKGVLLTRAGPGDGTTLYIANDVYADAKALSRTPLRSRPSVSDDGSLALFVSLDGRLIKVRTDPSDPRETVVDAKPVWATAAISKDGLRWAATKASRDTAIYVGDFAGGETRKFPLFRPTGLGVRTAIYAGSLEWDHSGENVLFDVFNRIRGTNGSSMEYWDAGLLQAWDKQAGKFGEGLIYKAFGDLPDGSSVANPTFTKNSPGVVAYEYTAPDGAISIRGRDIETRAGGIMLATSMIGNPSFDRDDAWMAFTSRNGQDTVISRILLNPEKLTATGLPEVVATGFKWPVLFAKGKRTQIPADAVEAPILRPELRAAWQGATRSLSLEFAIPSPALIRLYLYGLDGRTLETLSIHRSAGSQRMVWTLGGGRPVPGLRFVRLVAGGLVLRTRVLEGN